MEMQGRQFIAALTVLALLGGCGGSDEGGTADSSSGASKAEFVKEANAVCNRMVARIQNGGYRLFRENGKPGETQIFGRKLVHEVIVPNLEGEIHGISGLQSPAGDEAQVKKILAELHKVIDQVEADPSAHGFYPYKKAEAAADAYGLTSCGRPTL